MDYITGKTEEGYEVTVSHSAMIRFDDTHFAIIIEGIYDGDGLLFMPGIVKGNKTIYHTTANVVHCEDDETPEDRIKSGIALASTIYEEGKMEFPEV